MDIIHESRLMSPIRVITQKWEQLPRIPREAQPNPIINKNNDVKHWLGILLHSAKVLTKYFNTSSLFSKKYKVFFIN